MNSSKALQMRRWRWHGRRSDCIKISGCAGLLRTLSMRCELSMLFRSSKPYLRPPSHERFLSIRQFRCPRPTPRQCDQALSPDVLGKLQPQALELEEAVLGRHDDGAGGGQLRHRRVEARELLPRCPPSDLRRGADLFHASEPIDILTVTEALRKLGDLQQVGGTGRRSVDRSRGHSANIGPRPHRAQKYIQRELIRVSSIITQKAFGRPRTYWTCSTRLNRSCSKWPKATSARATSP